MRGVAVAVGTGKRWIFPILTQVGFQVTIGYMQCDMWQHGCVVQNNRGVLMLANEVNGLLVDPVGGIVGTLETVIASWVERVRIVG